MLSLSRPCVRCLRYRVRFHGRDFSALHAVIQREYLPSEYLGTCGEAAIEWLDEQIELDEQSMQDAHGQGAGGEEDD